MAVLAFSIHSSDGSITTATLQLGPVHGLTPYTFKGKITEKDNPEKGVTPQPYPASVSGTLTFIGADVSITAIVKELSTQP